jgi:hypothetical protein
MNALSPQLLNVELEYAIRKVKEKQVGLNLDETYEFLMCADNVNVMGDNTENQ